MAKQKRRLRKKLYKGEFTVRNLIIEFTHTGGNNAPVVDDLIDLLVPMGLRVCGIFDEHAWAMVSSAKRYESVTEDQKAQIVAWLTTRKDVSKTVAWLSDAYN